MEKLMSAGKVLLVMDVQENIMKRFGDSPVAAELLGSLQRAIAAARGAGLPVIYVMVGFRKGLPEISPNNQSFSAIKKDPSGFPGIEEAPAVSAAVAPQAGDVVVVKRRVSAFTGSDLEVVLRGFGVNHLVLAGVSTSGVVLSTVREAADKDFKLTVLSDGCVDPDPEVHNVLLTKVFPRQAEVLTSAEWISSFSQSK